MKVTLSTGETLTYPVVTRGVTQFIAMYSVRASDVNRLLPKDLRAYDAGYGLADMMVYWLHAEDSDFGPFCELAVNFAVREPYYGSRAMHYFANPVDTARAQQVGFEVWGNPTAMADINIRHEPAAQRCSVRMEGQPVLTLSSRAIPRGSLSVNALATAAGHGHTDVYRFVQNSHAGAEETNPEHVQLELGTHPLAAQLRNLLLNERATRSYYHTDSTILSGPPFARMFSLSR